MVQTRMLTRSHVEQHGESSTTATGMLTTKERSATLTDSDLTVDHHDDHFDVDFSVTTESGAHMMVLNNDGMSGDEEAEEEDLDFSVSSSGRTIEHIMQDQMQTGILPTHKSNQKTAASSTSMAAASSSAPAPAPAVTVKAKTPLMISAAAKSPARAIPQVSSTTHHHYQQHNNNNAATASHPGSQESSGSSFLSGILNPSATSFNNYQLSHTPPTAFGTSYENNHFGKRQRSGVRKTGTAKQDMNCTTLGHMNAFLNGVASFQFAFSFSSSLYTVSHLCSSCIFFPIFSCTQSVSGRLRSASDLEEKGLIDRQQKGILKDLIICGDEDLQQALDQYEDGNPAVLENMIRSGALQNKALPDLDLLGDLDLDFLTMNDIGDDMGMAAVGGVGGKEGPGMYTLPQQHQAEAHSHKSDHHRSASMPTMQPPTSFASAGSAAGKQQPHHRATQSSSGMVSPEFDDGIGELEFTGDFGETESGYDVDHTYPNDQHSQQQQQQHHTGRQNRATSPSIGEDMRLRSNSLFSALINDPRAIENLDYQYGRWMDRDPNSIAEAEYKDRHEDLFREEKDDGTDAHSMAATSQPISIPNADTDADDAAPGSNAASPRKKKGRRKSDSAVLERMMKAKRKQELQDLKKREKQEKREQKEREKQEKKEARMVAKAEKKKQKDQKKEAAAMVVEEEEKPVHIPGSGRPRSMSDPNFQSKRDEFGHVEIDRPDGWVGAYSPESRKVRIDKFLAKRHQRVWTKTVKYDVRKNFADSRLRVKGRFVKKEDETLMRELMSMT